MSLHREFATLVLVILATGVSAFAVASSSFVHGAKPKQIEDTIDELLDRYAKVSSEFEASLNSLPNDLLHDKLDKIFDGIMQEAERAERAHQEYHQVIIQEEDSSHPQDVDQQLRSIMLNKMQQMYEEMLVRMQNGLSHRNLDVSSESIKSSRKPDTSETGRLIDHFLYKKINELRAQGRKKHDTYYDSDQKHATHVSERVSIMGDQNTYVPIFKFDGSSSDYCYPDWPSTSNDYQCVTTLNDNEPVFYEINTCDGLTVYTYWLWYGLQKPCIEYFDEGHGNDWEHVSVFVDPSDGLVSKVVFHQHGGHYTRRRKKYQSEGERVIVYIGKIAHGSYHIDCNGKCSWSEFFEHGCYGSERFCVGGCGYWDDFRNPGPELRNPTLYPLNEGQTIDGITRPDREVCGIGDCEGYDYRSLFESGCWQNKP